MKPIIAPSILSADFGYLAKDIEMVNRSEAEWVHIDIMDGVFVPNISFGFPVLKYVAKLSKKPLDVHLMIVNPEKFIPEVKALGAHTMNVHYEACPHLHRVVQQIREAGMQPAVTINPATPVALLQDIIRDVYLFFSRSLYRLLFPWTLFSALVLRNCDSCSLFYRWLGGNNLAATTCNGIYFPERGNGLSGVGDGYSRN